MSFTKKILMSMILGIITGVIINIFFVESIFISFVIENILATIGDLFLILLKMIVLPLIFVSVISGMISINDTSKLGRLGTKTIGMYLLTTAIATSLAVIFASFIIFDTQKVPMVARMFSITKLIKMLSTKKIFIMTPVMMPRIIDIRIFLVKDIMILLLKHHRNLAH